MADYEDGDFRFKGAAMLIFKALNDLKLGENCWCEVGIGNPNYRGQHTPQCVNARRAVEALMEVLS